MSLLNCICLLFLVELTKIRTKYEKLLQRCYDPSFKMPSINDVAFLELATLIEVEEIDEALFLVRKRSKNFLLFARGCLLSRNHIYRYQELAK